MRFLVTCLAVCFMMTVHGQKTSVYFERTAEFEKGLELFDKGIYGGALASFEKVIENHDETILPEADLLFLKAQLMAGKSAIRIGKPDAEKTMLTFFRNNLPDALAYEAVMDLGNYYYNSKNYDEAISFYKMIDASTLSPDQKAEIKFKEGYALFVKKKFAESKAAFNAIRNQQGEYYYPANYYYALSAYYTDDYSNAINAFKLVQDSKKYKYVVPIHICQLLLAQKKYDELIAYAEPMLGDPEIKKQQEIRQILGQAYFEMGDYDKALPYLEETAQSRARRPEDAFQLGVAQYKQKEYAKAIETLKNLSEQNSEMAMYAMFYMADSYLHLDDKQAARNAFFKAANKKFEPTVNEDALFNYAKLSVELGYDREAITTLQTFKPASKYYDEAQVLISDVLINTKDYEKAIKILEDIPNKSPKMTDTYQKVLFYRGIQLHNQKSFDKSIAYFNKAMTTGSDASLRGQSHFWIGEALYYKNDIDGAKKELITFLKMADGLGNLPVQGSRSAALYDLGYIYINEENYTESLKCFESSLKGFNAGASAKDPYVTSRLIPDITLRLGDNYLKKNNYQKARQFYDEAISKKYPNYVYALYQNAMIEGLEGDQNGKLTALKSIANNYPDSDFADDALLELGSTYEAMDRPEDGIAALKRLVSEHGKKSPLINKAFLKMGLLYYNQNEYTNALTNYKEVMKNNPTKDDSDAAMRAIKEIYVSDLKKPDDYFRYAETIPGYQSSTDEKDRANFQVADDYYENQKYKEAIPAYTEYIKKYPNGAWTMEAYYKRGDSYAALNQYESALKDFEYVLSLGQNAFYKDALEKSAIISYNHSQDFQKAYKYYNELTNLESREEKKFEAQLGALRSAYRIGKQQEVVRLADLVIGNSRASVDQKASAHFFKAKSAQDLKDYNTALESYNAVINTSETVQTAESRYRIAQIYYQRKDLETAEQLCQEAMESNSEYPYWVAKSLILTADILTDKGDYFNARAALEAVIENFDEDEEITSEAKEKLEKVKKKDTSGFKSNTKDDGDLEMDEE